MKTTLILVVLAAGAATGLAAESRPAKTDGSIRMHTGVPGTVYLGQPLKEFLARFPATKSTPFAQQADVLRLQVNTDGISALAMGATPESMTVESIGFNFAGTYEGIASGPWRTAEGIGAGSTINDLLGTYGKPAETTPDKRRGTMTPHQPPGPSASEPMRYVYRSDDKAVATYFVVQDAQVVRMVMNRLASIDKYLMKRAPATQEPATDGTPPAAPSGHP